MSFVSSRNQEIEKIKTLQTFADGSFGLIENEYGIITNKTLIADDTAESYDKIIQDLKTYSCRLMKLFKAYLSKTTPVLHMTKQLTILSIFWEIFCNAYD
ncbi:MAG: hypothetical protein HC932_02325 [Thermales bacterium]|nr:hypothetical protein [Thermales bacterium]